MNSENQEDPQQNYQSNNEKIQVDDFTLPDFFDWLEEANNKMRRLNESH